MDDDEASSAGDNVQRRFLFGPAVLVTAAFIGPGTVITASKAGAEFGCSLLWAIVFAVVTTVVLQEMAARLGIVTQAGLGKAISSMMGRPVLRYLLAGLVVVAILIGNAAYQTGNILGAASGIELLQPASIAPPTSNVTVTLDSPLPRQICVIVIGFLAAVVVLIGRYQFLQRALTVLVVAMSGLFLLAAIISRPSLAEIGRGLIPSLPVDSEWIVIGLIGTTVVPYNLFLHASLAANQWPSAGRDSRRQADSIGQSRRDTISSVALGGVVTAAILLTAANAFAGNRADSGSVGSVGDIARQLEPAIGSAARCLFSIGLFAAGLTSAITAPIAAGYAAAGCFGWPNALSDWRLKLVALLVIGTGVLCGLRFGASPQETIILAQAANGILLPLLAVLLLVAVNRKSLMSGNANGRFQNVMAVIVIAIVLLIAARQLKSVYEKLCTDQASCYPPRDIVLFADSDVSTGGSWASKSSLASSLPFVSIRLGNYFRLRINGSLTLPFLIFRSILLPTSVPSAKSFSGLPSRWVWLIAI